MQPSLPNHRGHDVHNIEDNGDQRCPHGDEPGSIEKKDDAEDEHEDRGQDRRKDCGPIVRLNVPRKPLSPDERLQREVLDLQRQHRACGEDRQECVRQEDDHELSVDDAFACVMLPVTAVSSKGGCPRVEIQREPDPPTKLTL